MTPPHADTWRILHIDDDDDDRFLVQAMLREAKGRRVVVDGASTFQEGRQKLILNHYQAVLVDYDLGVGTGIQLIREAFERGYAAPMILLTGRGSYEVDVEAMHAGATIYLTKNEINPLLLERSIRYAIERKQYERDLLERDRKLSIALDAAELGTWIYTFDDRVLEMDERAQRMYGACQSRELHDDIVKFRVHPDDKAKMWLALQQAADPAGDGRYQAEYRITDLPCGSPGTTRWINAWGLVDFEGSGAERRPVRLTGASRDITWEKQARLTLEENNRALQASEARVRDQYEELNQIYRYAPVGLFTFDREYRFLRINERMAEINGFPVDHHISRTLDEIVPDLAAFFKEVYRPVLERGEPVLSLEVHGRTPKAPEQERDWLCSYFPLRSGSGEVVGLIGAVLEITERKEAERYQQQLQEENLRQRYLLERLVQSAPVGIAFLSGPEHVYTLVNKEYERIARGKGQMIGRTVAEMWPEIAELVIPQMNRVYQTGEAYSIVNAPLTILRDGMPEADYFTYTFTPIYEADGQVEGVMILAVETTIAVRDRQAAEAQSARLEAILQALPVGVWISDREGRVLGKNEFADRIWGGKAPLPENIEAYKEYQMWDPITRDPVQLDAYPLAQTLRNGEPVEPVEMDIRRFDGSEGTVLISSSPILSAENELTGGVVICVDISDRRRAVEDLRQREESYRELSYTLDVERAKLAAAIENLPVGIAIGDPEGNTLLLNSYGMKLHSINEPGDAFSRFENFLHAFELRELDGSVLPLEAWPAAKAFRGEYLQNAELILRNKLNGNECVVSYSVAPAKNTNGETVFIVYVIQDLTERKQIEAALRASEQRYRLAAQATKDAIWDWDLSSDLIEWNEAIFSMFGYPADENHNSSRWWKSKLHPDDRDTVIRSIESVVYNSGDIWTAEYRFRRADGSYANVFDRGWVVRDELGRPLRMVGAMRNITEEKEAEALLKEWNTALRVHSEGLRKTSEALRHSEEQLRQLADAMPQLVWTARADGTVDYYNQRYQLYDGIASVDADRWEWNLMVHPDDVNTTLSNWKAAAEVGDIYQIEHRLRMADGSYRWHLSRGIPAYDEHGRLVKWYGTATDIHDFKQIQEELRHREMRLRGLFEADLIGIVARDTQGNLLEANDGFLNMLGYAREDLEAGGLNVFDFTPLEYHASDHQASAQLLEHGVCRPYEKEYFRKDGSRVPVLIGYSLVENGSQEFIGFVMDMSELKQAQADLAAYAEKLKSSNEDLENFAFMASHDLKEPMRKILTFGSSLRRQMAGQLSDEAEIYLDRMENASNRMQAMINSLLDLSRINTHGSEFERVDLTTLAREAASDLEPRIEASGGTVQIDPLPSVLGDPVQLRQLMQNLIGNALKYHQNGVAPLVRVRAEVDQSDKHRLARILVEDNGIGFDESEVERIFQAFVRLHGRQFDGSGIGLAICRKIVERHGGAIIAHSKPGEGSTFVVTLPLPS